MNIKLAVASAVVFAAELFCWPETLRRSGAAPSSVGSREPFFNGRISEARVRHVAAITS